jgi:hypothetical protein
MNEIQIIPIVLCKSQVFVFKIWASFIEYILFLLYA